MRQINHIDEYFADYQRSIEAPEAFWGEIAEDFLWQKKWDTVLDWNFSEPSIKWFDGGVCNLSENCIDRHLAQRGDQTAIIWEPNNPNEASRHVTYNELHHKVCQLANALQNLGVKKGDRVCIYMPMIIEGAVAMLACARIGAIHSVVFAGFSAQSLIDRINDSACSLIITADAVYRGEKKLH